VCMRRVFLSRIYVADSRRDSIFVYFGKRGATSCIFSRTVSIKIIRRCIPDEEVKSVLSFCHEFACSGYLVPARLLKKCYKMGFIGPVVSKTPLNFARRAHGVKW